MRLFIVEAVGAWSSSHRGEFMAYDPDDACHRAIENFARHCLLVGVPIDITVTRCRRG